MKLIGRNRILTPLEHSLAAKYANPLLVIAIVLHYYNFFLIK